VRVIRRPVRALCRQVRALRRAVHPACRRCRWPDGASARSDRGCARPGGELLRPDRRCVAADGVNVHAVERYARLVGVHASWPPIRVACPADAGGCRRCVPPDGRYTRADRRSELAGEASVASDRAILSSDRPSVRTGEAGEHDDRWCVDRVGRCEGSVRWTAALSGDAKPPFGRRGILPARSREVAAACSGLAGAGIVWPGGALGGATARIISPAGCELRPTRIILSLLS
jgi:hypothetical protein